MNPMSLVSILEPSDVGEARRVATTAGRTVGLNATELGQLSIIATETASNILKHTSGGEILMRPLERPDCTGVELLGLDKGCGIADLESSLRDGYSTAGSPGTGLGAISRLATDFDIYTQPGKGTALLARLCRQPRTIQRHVLDFGAVYLCLPGEKSNGDAWDVKQREDYASILMVDGLGHGTLAAEAAAAAVRVFEDDPFLPPTDLLEAIHLALRTTRGAAVAVARIESGKNLLRFAGVGNIAGVMLSAEATKHLVSHNGTAGLAMRKVQEFTYPWPSDALLVLQSDGITTHWDLDAYPGIFSRDPSLVAGILYRDFSRRRDDATVLVARNWRNL